MNSQASDSASHDETESRQGQDLAVDASLLGFQESLRKSTTSTASALSDNSELSSVPPSPPSSKATTPVTSEALPTEALPTEALPTEVVPTEVVPTKTVPTEVPTKAMPTPTKVKPRQVFDVRPKVSIPTDVAPYDYANQCIEAAERSRLNPYALHQEEYLMLRDHISHAQVTTYLNIRNGILRLWLNNPRIGVARDEAIGCAKDVRWFDVANVCYDWLLRRGYINYGCCEVPSPKTRPKKPSQKQLERKTIVVIGAGLSGLGCARHLTALSQQYAREYQELGEEPPMVVLVEGRNRVGGRVYSRAIDGSRSQRLFDFKGKRHSVEAGGMIITGFDRGNPLNVLVRGQMALPYYALKPEATLYDVNGKSVDSHRDLLVERLYNDCLERVSDYKFKNQPTKLIEGNRGLMDEGKDSNSEGNKTIAQTEEATAALPQAPPVSQQSLGPRVDLVPVSTDRATGRTHVEPGTPAAHKAAFKAKEMGWALKEGVTVDRDLDLEAAAKDPTTTLGSLVDEAISQYRDIVDLTPQDYRLLNWHIANLEYSNAINYNQLSLGGWDIDAGNEWEGKHTMVVGGYQSVPWGLAMSPSPLPICTNSAVKKITYNPEGKGKIMIECDNGVKLDPDYVVSTIPLGVLKHGNVEFDPPLPPWKTDVIGRLGFGILNKVILVYQEAFWDPNHDIFGVLRNPLSRHSLRQSEYTSQRGRFFQWFNVSNMSGVPVLLALMAGDAGFDTEHTKNDDLVAEATEVLRGVFGPKVPNPTNAIVTRWGSDKFARGSYSSAGPDMKPDDYETMSRPVANIYFAGEHTIGTHPATVHGAYLSGLRAASELTDAMLGPINIPVPLVIPKESTAAVTPQGVKRKTSSDAAAPVSLRAAKQAKLDAHEDAAWAHIYSQIGERPRRPQKVAGNAYLLYSKTQFEVARQRCNLGRRPGKGKPSPNEVRVMTSKMWKEATADERKPFEEQAAEQKRLYAEDLKEWESEAKDWDTRALEVRQAWEEAGNKLVTGDEANEDGASGGTGSDGPSGRSERKRSQKAGTSVKSNNVSDAEVAK
ncbi:flavin containing amine oxidoreductase [Apiospora rasikravindrae]|uniref:Flavin containing amine oxidoreductase n=1 Tax=Apiospora rasikravindrae TaxID=990691 RepID=A0ABR1U9L4_9PEZI